MTGTGYRDLWQILLPNGGFGAGSYRRPGGTWVRSGGLDGDVAC